MRFNVIKIVIKMIKICIEINCFRASGNLKIIKIKIKDISKVLSKILYVHY